ncbi:MAG: alpha/beta fold hydrolase [Allosphingosinicella sp.]|uniref:alpha/beta fold hydrolase n=1 Tax=Allosphingosinicella sp. TaxID=2823234 RepID=UPI0039528E3A
MKTTKILTLTLGAGLAACTPAELPARAPFEPTRFSVEVQGTGPDVILIPGLTAGRDVWSGTVRAVPGYRYHLVQVAGFAGDPPRGNAEGDVVAPLAEEIGRYIAASGLQRPAIVGHSMGGTVAMMIAARQPDRVGRVMVVDMLPQPAGLLGSSAANMGPLANSLRDLAATPGGRRLFESFLGNRGSDSDVVARAMHELATTDLTTELGRIRVPFAVVYAAPDARMQARADANYRAAYAHARDARLVRIDDSGHMIMYDQPRRFHEELKGFLAAR